MENKPKEIILDPNLTPEQRDIITSRGKNLLVSASAGSGKTRVMIERIIHMIKTREASVEDILVVTFTKAAAGEMKARLIKGLEGVEEKDEYILNQLSMVPSSTICTLHSFCAKLLKTYFYAIGLDPSFILIDEIEASALKHKAMAKLIDGRFILKDKAFFELLDIFSVNRKEDNFREIIFRFYEHMLTELEPDEWFNRTINLSYTDDINNNECARFVNDYVASIFEELAKEGEELNNILTNSGADKLVQVVNSVLINILKIKRRNTFLQNKANYEGFEKIALMPRKFEEGQELLKEQVIKFREKYKDAKELLDKHYMLDSVEDFKFKINETKRRLVALYEYQKQFKAIYDELKKEKVALDFSDLERYALMLLDIKEVREAIKDTYKNVFIDEYQDTNPIQEAIITKVAGINNLFMVGDVKQSIYKFRASMPEIFVNKYKTYSQNKDRYSEAKNLNHNFRSHQDILEFANDIFKLNMTEDFGQVNYKKDAMLQKKKEARLICSNGEPVVKVDFIMAPSKTKNHLEGQLLPVYSVKNHIGVDIEQAKKAEKEGKVIAKEILNILGKNIYIASEKMSRPVKYNDIVILTSSRGDYLELALKELKKLKIPYSTDIMLNVFEDCYVRAILGLLELASNRCQDIHLLSTLNSELFDFSVNDLADIRLTNKEKTFFYEALEEVRNNLGKVKPALRKKIENYFLFLDKISYLSKFKKVDEILSTVLYEMGLYDKIIKSEKGDKSISLLNKLITFLAGKSYNASLTKFLDYIKENQIEFESDSDDDGVRVTTIHKSKGLEYPVVILMGAGQDLLKKNSGEFVINPSFGTGIDYYDTKRRVKQKLIVKNAMKIIMDRTDLEERMRLLYVAVTRAINHLIITGVVNEDREIPAKPSDAKNFYDWIIPAINLRKEEGRFPYSIMVECVKSEDDFKPEQALKKEKIEIQSGSPKFMDEFYNYLTYKYPYSQFVDMPVKTSVSEILKTEDSEGFIPSLFTDGGAIASINKGLSYHKVLQHINFNVKTIDELNQELNNLIASGKITKDDLKYVKNEDILEFVTSSKIKELARGKILREQEFIALTRLGDSKNASDSVILQGVVDLICITDDGIIIGDYKTNNFRSEQKFIEKYKKQLDIYAEVIKESYGKPIKQKFIYSFNLKKFIYV